MLAKLSFILHEKNDLALEDDVEDDDAESLLDSAITSFVSNLERYDGDLTVSDVVSDIAETFFSINPDWRSWSIELGMSRSEIKSMVVDRAYEVLS